MPILRKRYADFNDLLKVLQQGGADGNAQFLSDTAGTAAEIYGGG